MGLSPLEKIEKTYKISIKKNNITLMPKNKDFQAFIQKIVIELNADNLAKKIQLIENEENYTIIRFNNYKLNELIDDKNFN